MMGLSSEFFFRIIGAAALAVGGAYLGARISDIFLDSDQLDVFILVFALIGALTGLILTPLFTSRPILKTKDSLVRMPAERLVAIIGGIFLLVSILSLDVFCNDFCAFCDLYSLVCRWPDLCSSRCSHQRIARVCARVLTRLA